MPKKSGLAQLLLIGGNDLSGDVGSLSDVSTPRGVLEVTGIDKSSIERVNGLADSQITFEPWFNDAAGAAHPVLSTLPTADVLVLYIDGSAIDDDAAALTGKQINYDWTRPEDGSLQGTVQVLGSTGNPLEWMDMLSAGRDVQSSSGTVASKDDGGSTANGLAAVLHIVAIASGTPTVIIEDSANDSTFATLKAFAAVADGAEPTAERVTVSGTVDRFLRLNITGTFTNLDYAVAYRRGESVDDKAYA